MPPLRRALQQGKRRALMAAMAIGVSGCVLPIAPEFETERNVPPFVKLAEPPLGITATDPGQTFRVTIEDPNRADTIYFQWLIDYPPYAPNITRIGQRNAVPSRGPDEPNEHVLNFLPACEYIATSLTQHRLMLAVSDRPFEETTGPVLTLDKTAPGAHALRAVWNFEKECP